MYIVSLLAAPSAANLQQELLDGLMHQWQGQDQRWLRQNVAGEFAMRALPDDADQVWSDLQSIELDLVIHPASSRRKRLLLADMDSTMINQECIDELAAFAGVGDHVAEITAKAMNGELNFHDALVERVGLLKGLPETVIDEVIQTRITLAPGAPELVATMRANGAYTALVSGGFTAFTEKVAQWLGFDEHRANTLLEEDGILTGHVALPVLGREAKTVALEELAAQLSITPQDVLAVGDGANDLGMLQLAGLGVAVHAKPSVAAQVNARINHADLTALLYLQGYSFEEFYAPPTT